VASPRTFPPDYLRGVCLLARNAAGFNEMEFRFNAEEWVGLPPEERARQCRLMAAQARSLAQSASSPELKRSYSNIAAEWDELAQEINHWFPG